MVAKHVNATVLTTLLQMLRSNSLPETQARNLEQALAACLPGQIRPYLFTVEGMVRDVPLSVAPLAQQIAAHKPVLLSAVMQAFQQGWPASDSEVVTREQLETVIGGFADQLQAVIDRLFLRLQWALGQLERLRKVAAGKGALDADEEALRARCERLVKKLKGAARRNRNQAEGIDDTNTYGVLAAEGFLPGYGLDTGAVTLTHVAPRHSSDISDWELRRNTALAVREYVPGNLIYANAHKFVPRHFHLIPEEPLTFAVDVASESVQETGPSVKAGSEASSMTIAQIPGVAICDVDAPHQSYISDDEDYRFQLSTAVFAQDQGRHSGGRLYEWGKSQLQLKHAMHMRLVNVGAASQVRSGVLLGYPLCLVCGASRSAMSSQAELDKFNEHHTERCGRPIQNIAFYAEVVADALVLQDCASQETAYSVMESLRQGAADVLDMEISDLQVQVIGKPGSELVDVLLYDPMPGGSGLLEQLLAHWPDVVAAARRLAYECPSACESSCVDCLQHFRNSFYHDKLNRHTALDAFNEWGDTLIFGHELAAVLPDETLTQQPGNPPEQQLVALLKAAGMPAFETERPIALSGGITTRPDVYFHEPNDQYEGVCIYLDGMSEHLHGNAQTAAKDRQIRQELLNTDYEVIEIQFQELYDKTVMREHMRRIAKAVVGRAKAKELAGDDGWFEQADKTQVTVDVGAANVLPFKTVQPGAADFEPYRRCVPLVGLQAAAGAWSEEQSGIVDLSDDAEDWVVIDDHKLEQGMFVAQVVGCSMEPLVPDGSYCLFRPVPAGSRQGRKLLVWHAGVTDADNGGEYTLKVYSSEKVVGDDGEWQHDRITLKPLNPDYQALVLEPDQQGAVRVVAEFVSVLG